MGLDITAYTKLTKIDAVFNADGEPIDPETREPLDWHKYVKLCTNDDFPGREEGVEDNGVYEYAGSYQFRAGSYGGYSGWREQLAELAGYPMASHQRYEGAPPTESRSAAAWQGKCAGLPFVELVNFSDCEGVIGPVVAAKLAKDFADFDDRAKLVEWPYFYDRYECWRRAFELAADAGAVDFH